MMVGFLLWKLYKRISPFSKTANFIQNYNFIAIAFLICYVAHYSIFILHRILYYRDNIKNNELMTFLKEMFDDTIEIYL